MVFKRSLLYIIGCIILAAKAMPQIYAPSANGAFSANYNSIGGTDSVFVFNTTEYQGAVSASIRAESVDKTTGWNFQWAVYNSSTGNYVNLPALPTGWFSEIDTITLSSGYRVEMTKGGSTYIFRVWIAVNDFNAAIINKDAEDKLQFGYYNCSSLDLIANTIITPLTYYNPNNNTLQTFIRSLTIRWTTDNPEAVTPSYFLITRVNNPPSSDTWYFLSVKDNFQLNRKDSVFYESIQSEANLSGTYVNLSDTAEYPGKNYGNFYSDNILSAPGKYRFDISGSRNMAGYSLNFGDGTILNSGTDTLVRVHEFLKPGNYKVVLTTKSGIPYECLDSVSYIAQLDFADKENFSFPNVFSPNADGENDTFTLHENNVFRSADVSVVAIEISIFDRSGRKVHQYSGNIRDWEGWDGLVMNSNRQAPEGVYFYIITVLKAWEDNTDPINRDIMKGFFHLYRE